MKRAVARLVDAAFNRYAPIVHGRTIQAFTTADTVGADWLTRSEADIDTWEPAHNPPAGAGAAMTPPSMPRPAQTAPAGSPDDVTVADIKVIVSRVMRDCGVQWPATVTDIVTLELLHHFDFRHK